MTYKTTEFINKAKLVHGDKYDYCKVKYNRSHEKVIIICKVHGDFLQTPSGHLLGRNCKKCADNLNGNNCKSNVVEFINKAKFNNYTNYIAKLKN